MIICSYKGVAQSKQLATITQVEITDTTLKNNIRFVLEKYQKNNAFFKKGYGYVNIFLQSFSQGDTLRRYNISPSLVGIKHRQPDRYYPDYYSYINNKLILIHIDALDDFLDRKLSEKDKKRIRKLVDNTLEPTRTIVLPHVGKRVKDKHFRPDYFLLDGGLNVFVLKGDKTILAPEYNF